MSDIKIMYLIGNGFDIGTLSRFGDGVTSAYSHFYNYFKYKNPSSKDNKIIKAMEIARDANKENWSDIEGIIGTFFEDGYSSSETVSKLAADLSEVQFLFSKFLNELVTDDVLAKVSAFCFENKVAGNAFMYFLKDLSSNQYSGLKFPAKVVNHDSIDFNIINFNYTSLLDNYLYLDRSQFDPVPYNYSNNNFNVYLNPNEFEHEDGKYEFDDPYVRIKTNIYHPHGYQDIPKSLLFGSEDNNNKITDLNDNRKFFIKSLCAQDEDKYLSLIEETKLFIVYGCSLGASDSWWWNKILREIAREEDNAELIIYYYDDGKNSLNEDEIKNLFIRNASCMSEKGSEYLESNKELIKERIFVIKHGPCGGAVSFMQY